MFVSAISAFSAVLSLSMFPKEHGAYGQLLFPLVTALAIGRPSAGALALAAAAIAAFLAHEPLLVLLGQRGPRAAREQRGRAWWWFAGFGIPAAVLAALAFVWLPAPGRHAMIIIGVLALVLLAIIASGREHSQGGEVMTALTLSALCAPIAIGSGASFVAAHTTALVFAVSFVSATFCVHGVILRTRKPPAIPARTTGMLVAAASVAALVVLARLGYIAAAAPWAALPMCVGGFALAACPPSARQLRVVGWTLVGATTVTAAVLVAALR